MRTAQLRGLQEDEEDWEDKKEMRFMFFDKTQKQLWFLPRLPELIRLPVTL